MIIIMIITIKKGKYFIVDFAMLMVHKKENRETSSWTFSRN